MPGLAHGRKPGRLPDPGCLARVQSGDLYSRGLCPLLVRGRLPCLLAAWCSFPVGLTPRGHCHARLPC
jgi:hypothetical protein